MKTFDLQCSIVTLPFLAQVVNALEEGEEVTIKNAARPMNGAGFGAFLLGQQTSFAVLEQRIAALESRMNDVLPELS